MAPIATPGRLEFLTQYQWVEAARRRAPTSGPFRTLMVPLCTSEPMKVVTSPMVGLLCTRQGAVLPCNPRARRGGTTSPRQGRRAVSAASWGSPIDAIGEFPAEFQASLPYRLVGHRDAQAASISSTIRRLNGNRKKSQIA
jgi:hypothetical protein